MANYTKLDDTLSGSEGKGFITRSGQNREMFEISKIDAHVTLSVTEKKLLGHRMKLLVRPARGLEPFIS